MNLMIFSLLLKKGEMMKNDNEHKMSSDPIHCLRTMLQNNIQFITLADRKAGIVLGANFVALSILISQIATHGWLVMLVIPLCFSIIVTTLAILVLSPRIKKQRFKNINNLFFEVAAAHQEHDYIKKIQSMLSSPESVYEAMIIDFYQLSVVLHSKYKYLKWCYNTCILGLSITLIYSVYFMFHHLFI